MSNLPPAAHDGDSTNHPPTSPIESRLSPLSFSTPTRSNTVGATAEPQLSSVDGLGYPPPQSASSSGDVGTSISRRSASTPGPVSNNNDRARGGRKDVAVVFSKDYAKEPQNSRDSPVKDAREQRATGRTAVAPVVQSPTAIDPLSHYILAKANSERSIASRLLNPTRPESPANESLARTSVEISNKLSALHPESARDKKKGVSLLSRLSMLGSKKRGTDIVDDESELSDHRTEGANAIAFSSALYIPHHKEPPRYIRVRAQHKRTKEFNRIFLAQELVGTQPPSPTGEQGPPNGDTSSETSSKDSSTSGGPIWAVGFSQDGRFLATGGRDRVLRVWAVIATEEERKAYDDEENGDADKEARLSAPAFHSKPVCEFVGHEGDILDLSWSKNNFLLSSSMDKTVRLWHMSRKECLCTFKHKDFVASIAFHPRDDRFFLAGSLDSSLRLWSIPDKAIAYSSQLSDIVTAVGFSPDGKTAIAGCFHGLCVFFETEGLKFSSQMHVRSSRGKNAKGSKITGLQTINVSPDNADSGVKLLVTSNDSRIRIYNLADQTLEAKFKGHENAYSQIRASFSDDGAYVICGSEDRKAFIWSKDVAESEGRACEHFEAHSELVTAALFAPTKTRQLLQASQDPIFTLCNPPPVTLRSMEEMTATSTYDGQAETRKPEESPAFVARSAHREGNIIVTTDSLGIIKVFRQDCAFVKRRNDIWETGSTFSKKMGRDKRLGRTGSIITGTTSVSSRDPNSRRGSMSLPLHITSDRIDTWRRGVEGNPGRPLSLTITGPGPGPGLGATSSTSTSTVTTAFTRSDRSPSPSKMMANHPPALTPSSPAASLRSSRTGEPSQRVDSTTSSVPPTPSFTFRSADDDYEGNGSSTSMPESVVPPPPPPSSASFWRLNKWRAMGLSRGGDNNNNGNGNDSTMMIKSSSPLSKQVRTGSFKLDDTASRKSTGSRLTPEQRENKKEDRRWSSNTSRLWPSPLEERDEGEDYLATPIPLPPPPPPPPPPQSPPPIPHSQSTHPRPPNPSNPPPIPVLHRMMTMTMDGGGSRSGSISSEHIPTTTTTTTTNTLTNTSNNSTNTSGSEDGEEMECVKCGNRDFRAKRVGGVQRLLCGNCGRVVD
ncbi:WD40 repeat-like protein [Xylaria sp. CBS 124048]|nr:WD40 repeat-like protein [Xylaria sp. CBS 124048]